ncbi:GGDEF domain-containing protein [Metabacillus niabensis]|uniref:GGDEF domain-containing protein n=1 Tax=Metabacillus niabensis TaxID=324854 RepID=UPI001CFC34CD|nr:diguanylate cyclase [Metabacillus niabensis]
MFIKELIINLAILCSLIFLYTQFTKSSPLKKTSSLQKKLLIGILGGLFSNVLMHFSINIENAIVDLRHIPVILLAFYGGSVPALTSMLLIIVGRFLIGINTSSYAALILIVLITFTSIYFSNSKLSEKVKIFLTMTISNIIFTLVISYLIRDIKILMVLVPLYWGISYLSGYFSYYILTYLRNSQELFDKYKSESSTDGLTGLYNVRKFDELFNTILKNIESKDEMLSLLYIDIDYFKKVNDIYGHTEGDIVLKELGSLLKKSTRSFDIVSRNGGEEFTVILLDCPLDRAKEISERIRGNVEKHSFFLGSGEQISVTVSIGVACFKDTTKDSNLLIEDADRALYVAKRSGRNRVCVAKN